MQKYNNMQTETNFAKEIILDFLDYIRYKVENDRLTLSEADSIARTIQGGIKLTGTVDDLCGFYGQSRNNVKAVIGRKMLGKPERRVYYPFNSFNSVVPPSWKEKRHGNGSVKDE